ncbi:hypothetical protein R3W88_005162 [Solanum pinnatisectum]|uniref:Uncharacterized protein n=1 Tax=Solanum pinnatisectum TaxID=50273 RepID=A0AAV9KBD5_9SOLN|nr:hypothetical protein R3W88_005162 [Solanum pinnatisectum]
MDEAPNSSMDSDNLYSSTIPWANEFDFGEEVELSKIFDMPQEQRLNTSELPKVVPTNTTNISGHSSTDKNTSRITYPITLDDDDDYSLSYIYSMGLKNEENPKTFIPIPIVMEKQESSLKSKFTTNQPMRTSTDSWKEQENNKTNDMILQQPMSLILTLEKLESHLIKSKLMVGQENGISSGGYGILSSFDNEFPQNASSSNGCPIRSPNRTSSRYQPFGKEIDPNNQGSSDRHSILNIPQNLDEYTQGYGYSNEAITLRSLNSGNGNEDGAPVTMDEVPNNYIDIDNQDLYSSTIPWDNEFDFGEEAGLSKIFDLTQEHPMNTSIIPSTSIQNSEDIPELPMTTTNISGYSSADKNSSKITHPITVDDYSLSYINFMGCKNSTSEKLQNHSIESKLMVGQQNGILSSMDNVFPQNTSRNGGPIRSPNSTRYQPFGKEIDPNSQGSDRHVFSLLFSKLSSI